jgi:hypothetical protein
MHNVDTLPAQEGDLRAGARKSGFDGIKAHAPVGGDLWPVERGPDRKAVVAEQLRQLPSWVLGHHQRIEPGSIEPAKKPQDREVTASDDIT